ncbi:MAG: M20 family peptidase [Desulfobacteraceae bacterium]|nr:MAG: M20 family peptidase [Desulfobacteraceae bacterium]
MADRVLSKLDPSYTLRILKDMIRIPSVVGEEGDLARYIFEELKRLGLECRLHEIEPGRPNVYARIQGSPSGRKLHFNGHTDTIPVVEGWETDPFEPTERNGRIYGLGACDMKGGIACIMDMMRAFSASKYRFDGEISFSAVIDEEAFSKGAKAVLDTEFREADAVVLAEPYAGDADKPIPLGITGKVLYDILVKGKAAHGFSPQNGINAVEEAARILCNLNRLDFKKHPDFGKGNFSTLKIEGGYKVYSVVVPDRCRFEVNRLLVPGETAAGATEDMESLIRSLKLAAEVEVKMKPPRYEAYMMKKDAPILKAFDSVYREVTGAAPVYNYSNGITDANVFAGEAGIDCLHLGPKRGAVHQKNEYVSLECLPRISRMFTLTALRFLSNGNDGRA